MFPTPVCYMCKQELQEHDLIYPLSVDLVTSSGRIFVHIFMHYMCGLNSFLDNLYKMDNLTNQDRIEIEAKLMHTITSISKGTLQ